MNVWQRIAVWFVSKRTLAVALDDAHRELRASRITAAKALAEVSRLRVRIDELEWEKELAE